MCLLLGRYFSATLIANAVCITNVRTPLEAEEEERQYYITDGIYGSLSSARFDPFMKFIPLTVQIVRSRVEKSLSPSHAAHPCHAHAGTHTPEWPQKIF